MLCLSSSRKTRDDLLYAAGEEGPTETETSFSLQLIYSFFLDHIFHPHDTVRHPNDTAQDELRLITRALDQLFGMINHYYPGTYSQKCFCYHLIGLALDNFIAFFRLEHLKVLCHHLTGHQEMQEECSYYCWKYLTPHLEPNTVQNLNWDDDPHRGEVLATTIYKNVVQKHPDHRDMLPLGVHPLPIAGRTRDLWTEWSFHLQPLEDWWERFTQASKEVERLQL